MTWGRQINFQVCGCVGDICQTKGLKECPEQSRESKQSLAS